MSRDVVVLRRRAASFACETPCIQASSLLDMVIVHGAGDPATSRNIGSLNICSGPGPFVEDPHVNVSCIQH